MSLKSILILLAMIAFFSWAIWWIAKNGGWKSENSCHGDCKSCQARCEEQATLKKLRAERAKKAAEEAEK